MSEQEKNSGGGADLSVVVVDTASRHKQPFHPIDMQEEVHKELQHKRSKVPAVPSVNEELKDNANLESIEKNESMSSETYKHNVAKKLSSGQTKRRGSSPESLKLAPLTVDVKEESSNQGQPIPAVVPSIGSDTKLAPKKKLPEKTEDEDSITEEIADLRTAEAAKVSSEWSDEEEAGGLPRSDSRASRVTRAVRQLFCCGIALEPPSEYKLSPRTDNDIA